MAPPSPYPLPLGEKVRQRKVDMAASPDMLGANPKPEEAAVPIPKSGYEVLDNAIQKVLSEMKKLGNMREIEVMLNIFIPVAKDLNRRLEALEKP